MPTEMELLPDEQKRLLVLDLFKEFGISEYRKSGHELTHRCTLGLGGHSDGNSWTASVNYKKLSFNCFVCGHGGSLSWWIAVNRGETTAEQVTQWLKQKTGLAGNVVDLPTLMAVVEAIANPESETERMPYYDDRLLKRWHEWPGHHPYLTDPRASGGRAIPSGNLDRFEIGYADLDHDFGYFQRIIIPVRWKGDLVGWQARALTPEDPEFEIKYKNSPMFPRDRILYGDVESRGARVVVESPMSVLRHCHQSPMVATFGTKITETQLRLLRRYDRLVFFLDPDKAGYSSTAKTIRKLSRHPDVRVVDNPWKADAGDLNDDDFDKLINTAVPAALWTPKRYHELLPYEG
jgi:hypothetical protein